MKRRSKARTVAHTRLVDCAHYSRCLMEAAVASPSSGDLSCAMCQGYKTEKVTDEDRVLEAIRALKLFDRAWKDCATEVVPW